MTSQVGVANNIKNVLDSKGVQAPGANLQTALNSGSAKINTASGSPYIGVSGTPGVPTTTSNIATPKQNTVDVADTSAAKSGGGSSSSTGGGVSYVDNSGLINQMGAANEALIRQLAEQQNGLAKQNYDTNLAALNAAYGDYTNGLKSNYDSAQALLDSQYNNDVNSLNKSGEQQLRDAYVSRMMSQRNLGNQLASMGLSGGASETVAASLLNNYNNNRNAIQNNVTDNLTKLLSNYQTNSANALSDYNTALGKAGLDQYSQSASLLNNYNHDVMGNNSAMYNALLDNNSDLYGALMQNALNGAKYGATSTSASSGSSQPVSAQVADSTAAASDNVAKASNGASTSTSNKATNTKATTTTSKNPVIDNAKNLLSKMRSSGMTDKDIASILIDRGLSDKQIQTVFTMK